MDHVDRIVEQWHAERPDLDVAPLALVGRLIHVSQLLNERLVAAGLVERRPDPDDRRGTRVRLTRRGRAVFDRALEAHLQNEERVLGTLKRADRRELDRLLRQLLEELE